MNGLKVKFLWIDDEIAEITCPNCKEALIINIYEEDDNKCVCGKRYLLHQRNWVTEIVGPNN